MPNLTTCWTPWSQRMADAYGMRIACGQWTQTDIAVAQAHSLLQGFSLDVLTCICSS